MSCTSTLTSNSELEPQHGLTNLATHSCFYPGSRQHLAIMDTEAVQEAAPTQVDHFSALPVELITAILGELSVPEICRARALSTHFKAIIDTHQLNILRPTISRTKLVPASTTRLSAIRVQICAPHFKGSSTTTDDWNVMSYAHRRHSTSVKYWLADIIAICLSSTRSKCASRS